MRIDEDVRNLDECIPCRICPQPRAQIMCVRYAKKAVLDVESRRKYVVWSHFREKLHSDSSHGGVVGSNTNKYIHYFNNINFNSIGILYLANAAYRCPYQCGAIAPIHGDVRNCIEQLFAGGSSDVFNYLGNSAHRD
jgi:hypothetical protein